MESHEQNISEEQKLQPKITALFNELIKNPKINEALTFLDSLPDNLKYHNKKHTLDVIHETILFALADGLDEKDIELEAIAAAWHDVGYLKKYDNNEPTAVEMFQQSESSKDISEEDKKEIIANILDTQIVIKDNKPSFLEQKSKFGYVSDADLSNLGRKDFFDKNLKFIEETRIDMTDINAKKKFYISTIELMKNHNWRTESAKRLRQQQKEINLKKLEEEYAKL
jgi:hypothetical protein